MKYDIEKIIKILQKGFGENELLYKESVFKILIRTVLSQRTRDENSDKAVENLFSKYTKPEEILKADIREIKKLIKSAGFYKIKAKRIKEISKIIVEKYKGSVPDNMEELLELPGVGRKTAGIVMVYGFGKPVSIPVDTHLHRVFNRMGLVNTKKPEQTEYELMKLVQKTYWTCLNNIFVRFGQKICKPTMPLCFKCPVKRYCKY